MAILTQRANVTTLGPVTVFKVVTSETVVPQYLSPLSPLSLVLILAIHARDKGLGTTSVTGDAGDTGDRSESAPVSRSVAMRLAQPSQSSTPRCRFIVSGGQEARTAPGQKLTFLQIDVLRASMWFSGGWRFIAPSKYPRGPRQFKTFHKP
jgi:hypothetical protein